MKTLKLRITKTEVLKRSQLKMLPGNPKDADPKEIKKLQKEMLTVGITQSWSVWRSETAKRNYILDGNQRTKALDDLIEQGKLDPDVEIPVQFVEAKDIEEASRMALGLISQYGRVNRGKLEKFSEKAGMSFSDAQTVFSFPELELQAKLTGDDDGEESEAPGSTDKWAKVRVGKCPACQALSICKDHRVRKFDPKDIVETEPEE